MKPFGLPVLNSVARAATCVDNSFAVRCNDLKVLPPPPVNSAIPEFRHYDVFLIIIFVIFYDCL